MSPGAISFRRACSAATVKPSSILVMTSTEVFGRSRPFVNPSSSAASNSSVIEALYIVCGQETGFGYPQARPDCFWADGGLRLASGGMPINSAIQVIPDFPELGQLIWFSWHLTSWDPNRDNLVTYLHAIRRRLRDPR